MKLLVAVAILLAVTSVSAQIKTLEEKAAAVTACPHASCSKTEKPYYSIGKPTDPAGRRKLAGVSMTSRPRKLLGTDSTVVTSQNQFLTKLCPTAGTNVAYSNLVDSNGDPVYGQLLHDNGVCVTSTGRGNVVTASNSSGAIYGGAAQDFGSYKTTWETYGWSLFKLSAAGLDPDVNWAWVQGINLHLIGAVGTGHDGSPCSVTAISFGIYDALQTSPFTPSTQVYQKKIDVTGGILNNNFTWTSNTTTSFYTDIYDIYDNNVDSRGFNITADKYYWLRIKLFSDLTASKRCFVFWGMSSTTGNGQADGRARWQERVGGATGYSTNCLGAATSPTLVPGLQQTFWNCWNNGIGTTAYTLANAPLRRCATFRQSTNPPLVATDCQSTSITNGKGGAQFNDFNFALTGFQGLPGDVAIP